MLFQSGLRTGVWRLVNKTKRSQLVSSREPPWLSLWVTDDSLCVEKFIVFNWLALWCLCSTSASEALHDWVIQWQVRDLCKPCSLCSALSNDPTCDWALMGDRKGVWCSVTLHLSGGYLMELQVDDWVCLVCRQRLDAPYQECCSGDSGMR